MVLKKRARDLAKGFVNCRNLYENVCAVAIFFNHSLKSADLAFDSTKAIEVGGLDLGVDGDGVFTGAGARVLGFV